jgi:hypothetical protein
MYDTTDDFADNTISATEVFESIVNNATKNLKLLKIQLPADHPGQQMIDTILAYGDLSLDNDDTVFLISGQDAAMQRQIIADYVQENTEGLRSTSPVRLRILRDASIAKAQVDSLQGLTAYICGGVNEELAASKTGFDDAAWNYKNMRGYELKDAELTGKYQRELNAQAARKSKAEDDVKACTVKAWKLYDQIVKSRDLQLAEQYKKRLKDNGFLEKYKKTLKDFFAETAKNVNARLDLVYNSTGSDSSNPGSDPAPVPAPPPDIAPPPPPPAGGGSNVIVHPIDSYTDPVTGITWYWNPDTGEWGVAKPSTRR